jgi:tRNA(Arg) A34 adenosine deaminase TadA
MLKDLNFIQLAIDQAKESIKQGGFPAGCVLVKDGQVIEKGIALGFKLHDPTSHPETSCIRSACKKLQTVDLAGAVLYSSLQPCMMCFSVATWAGISKIVYAARKTEEMIAKNYYEGKQNLEQLNEQNNKKVELVFVPDLEKESLQIVKEWEASF